MGSFAIGRAISGKSPPAGNETSCGLERETLLTGYGIAGTVLG